MTDSETTLTLLATLLGIVIVTDAHGAANQCTERRLTAYECAAQAVEVHSGQGEVWAGYYADVPVVVAAAVARIRPGPARLTDCELADHLVTFAWYETTLRRRPGPDGEHGYTQVRSCESMGVDCSDWTYNDDRTRPTAEALASDPVLGLWWTGSRLEAQGTARVVFRSYNGSGPNAECYADRHLWAVDRIRRWREGHPVRGVSLRSPPTRWCR